VVQINFAHKEIQCKVVYYGPGMSGKTTNLELVHEKTPGESRGELTSIATTGERTLYFDYMPLDLGAIAGIKTKFQLYTVPGQIYYKSTRRLVLQGVDGIVFVADSSASKLEENRESMKDLEENLKEMGRTLSDVPIVVQYNKRDLPDAMSLDDLQAQVNVHGFPHFEAVAKTGQGVFPTLKALASLVLEAVNRGGIGAARAAKTAPAQPTTAGAAAAAPGSATGPSHAPPRPAPPPMPPRPAPAPAPRPAPTHVGHSGGYEPSPRISIAASGPGGAPAARSGIAVAEAPVAVAARPLAPHAPAPTPRPSTPAPAPEPSHAPHASEPAASGRSVNDRLVKVSGLGNAGRSNGKLVPFLVLGTLIAAAAWFVLTRLS